MTSPRPRSPARRRCRASSTASTSPTTSARSPRRTPCPPGRSPAYRPSSRTTSTSPACRPTTAPARSPRARARKDSPLVTGFRELGLNILGKSRLPEFGFSASTEYVDADPVRNPWDPEYSAGASSGGAASLVAAGVVPLAHANDGGGSIRIPAAVNGLVGLKPTRGRFVTDPHDAQLPVDIVGQGIVSRSVRDTARFFAGMEAQWRNDEAAACAPRHRPERDAPADRPRPRVTVRGADRPRDPRRGRGRREAPRGARPPGRADGPAGPRHVRPRLLPLLGAARLPGQPHRQADLRPLATTPHGPSR